MIRISGRRYNNDFRPSQDLEFLIANIGERVICETDFYFEDITYATADNAIIVEPDPDDVDLTDTTGIVWSEDGVAFQDYKVGDFIGIKNGSISVYEVTEILTSGMIRTTYTGSQVTIPAGDYVYNGTPITGVRYSFNLVQSGNSIKSLVDDENQMAVTDNADVTNSSFVGMVFMGKKSYQTGVVEIRGNGGTGGTGIYFANQSFTIKHEFIVTPLFLVEQYSDLVDTIAPDYFKDGNCLNYICQIEAGSFLRRPNALQSSGVITDESNTGWFNENFNAYPTNYSITGLTIENGSGPVDELRFDEDITVTITVANTTDTPFSSGNTQFIGGFTYLPEAAADYQANGRDFTDNFLFDNVLAVAGGTTQNGSRFGTAYQVIKTMTVNYTSSSECEVVIVINTGASAKAILEQGEDARYMLWVMVERHTLDDEKTDRVNLLARVGQFDKQLITTDLISLTTEFIRHPYGATETGYVESTGFEMFPVDDVVARSYFNIDFTGKTADGIVIKSIQNRIVLKHSTEADITLESFTAQVANANFIDGYIQNIYFAQNRVFKIPPEIRKTITVERYPDSDSSSVKYWVMFYPFMNRWEYWEALSITNPPTGIFDTSQPLSGLNHQWNRLINVSGWTAYYESIFIIEQNGQEFEQSFQTEIGSVDFDSGLGWINQSIKAYDSTGATELISGSSKYILGYDYTLIKANFEIVSTFIPDVTGVDIAIWIETYESGGIKSIRRASSAHELDSQSWFKSTDTSNKVVISKSGSVFTGSILIDNSKLPQNDQFEIYARIYDRSAGCSDDAINDESNVCLTDEGGNSITEE